MESNGRINSGPHSSTLSPAGSSGWFESVIKGYSRTLCQTMEAGKRAPHTQTPPRSATGQVPAFHLAVLPRLRRWSRLYGVWSCPAVSLAPVDHLTRLCDSVRPVYSQVQGHPPQSSEGSWCPCLVRESLSYWRRTWWNRSLQPIWRQGFSALTSLCPRKAVGYNQSWVCTSWTGPFINLLSRRSASSDASVPEIGLQRSTWMTRTSICQSFRIHRSVLRFAFEGRAYKYKVLPFGLSLSPRVFTKVAEAALVPLREQGLRILNYLDNWLKLAQSQDQLSEHRDLVLSHLSQLGCEKSKLSPMQRISFLGMELDSVN